MSGFRPRLAPALFTIAVVLSCAALGVWQLHRLDWKRGRHSVYGTGGLDWGTELIPPTFGTTGTVQGFNAAPGQTTDRNVYAQVGDTISMSPSFFLDIRYGGTRTHSTQ